MLKRILYRLIKMLRPVIRMVADQADLKLNYPHTSLGNHALIFEDKPEVYIHNIPKSAIFNTRSGKITVGKNTVFGEDVMILTGKHNYISEITSIDQLQKVPESGRDIIIGEGCYIGSGVIVIGPVNIGDYAVLGAGSVVTKDVDGRALYGGIPAKKIKDLIPKYEK